MPGWLGAERAAEISLSATENTTFHCHKTLDSNFDSTAKSKPCAGSILLHVKEGRGNTYYRFLDKEVTGAELVVDSVAEFIQLHT